jgi:hypothetical protein
MGLPMSSQVKLLYKRLHLNDNHTTYKNYKLKTQSEVLCILGIDAAKSGSEDTNNSALTDPKTKKKRVRKSKKSKNKIGPSFPPPSGASLSRLDLSNERGQKKQLQRTMGNIPTDFYKARVPDLVGPDFKDLNTEFHGMRKFMSIDDGPNRLAGEAEGLLSSHSHEQPSSSIEFSAWIQWPLHASHVARAALSISKIYVLLVFVPLGIVASTLGWHPIAISVFNLLGIITLSALVFYSADELSNYVGELVARLIDATFGIAVDLIVYRP